MSGNYNPTVNKEANVRAFEYEPFSEPETDAEIDKPKIEEIDESPKPKSASKEKKPKKAKSEETKPKEPTRKNRGEEPKSAANSKKKDHKKNEQDIERDEKKTKKPREENKQSKMKREEPPTKRPIKTTEPPVPKPVPKRTVTIKERPSHDARSTDTCIEKLQATSRLWKIGLCMFMLGILFDIMSFATPYWMVIGDATGGDAINVGLWCTCTTISNCTFRDTPAGCLNTLRGFHGISILLCVLISILLVVYVKKSVNKRSLGLTIIIITGLAALSTQITMGIFGKNYGCMDDVTSGMPGKWGWSMALAFVSIVCMSAAAILFYVQELRGCNGGKSIWRAWLGPDIRVT